MVSKLLESILSFGYNPPKDPEKLLYDFYFLVGYVYGNEGKILKEVSDEDGEQKAMAFVLNEAVVDCTNNLQKHMLRALKWSLSAEFRHVFSKTSSRYWEKELTPEAFKFLKVFREKYNALSDDYYRVFNPGRKQAKLATDEIASAKDIQPREGGLSGRNATYMDSYLAIQSAQKQLGYSEEQFANVLFSVYNDISWAGSYGGKNWAKIATAYKKLLAANTLTLKIIYIDHAYDLQHNTGSVFTKVKAYYKEGSSSLNWLAKALDWKRDARDLRDYYDMVSLGLKPLVGWVSKKFGSTIEERFPFGKADPERAAPETKTKSSASMDKLTINTYIEVSSPKDEIRLMTWMIDQQYVNIITDQPPKSMGYYEATGSTGYVIRITPMFKQFKLLQNKQAAKNTAKKNGSIYFKTIANFFEAIEESIPNSEWVPTGTTPKVGDTVKLMVKAPNIPEYGWGNAKTGDIGKVLYAKKSGDLEIEFPKHSHWSGKASEVVVVKKQPVSSSAKTPAPGKITVGDQVKVVAPGHTYSSYISWAEAHGFDIVEHASPEEGKVYGVIAVGPHGKHEGDILYGIYDGEHHYIIGEPGIKLQAKGNAVAGKHPKNLEPGKYYKWVGPSITKEEATDGWFTDGGSWNTEMFDYMMDGKPHKVVSKGNSPNPKVAKFEGMDETWYWHDFDKYFEEVPNPSEDLGDDDLHPWIADWLEPLSRNISEGIPRRETWAIKCTDEVEAKQVLHLISTSKALADVKWASGKAPLAWAPSAYPSYIIINHDATLTVALDLNKVDAVIDKVFDGWQLLELELKSRDNSKSGKKTIWAIYCKTQDDVARVLKMISESHTFFKPQWAGGQSPTSWAPKAPCWIQINYAIESSDAEEDIISYLPGSTSMDMGDVDMKATSWQEFEHMLDTY